MRFLWFVREREKECMGGGVEMGGLHHLHMYMNVGKNARGENAIGKNVRGKIAIGKNVGAKVVKIA